MYKIMSNKRTIAVLVLPGILLFALTVLFPILYSAYLGLFNYNGYSSMTFVGLKNYIDILSKDKIFWQSLFHSLILAVVIIVIQHPFSIFMAILVDKIGRKLEKAFRIIFFAPCVISAVVICSMWSNLLNSDFGIINKIFAALGLKSLSQISLLSDTRTALGTVIFVIIWMGWGWAFLVYYAGIKGIPEDVFEAAKIDGASGFKMITRITLPLLAPVLRIGVTLGLLAALKELTTPFLLTGGGPGNATNFISYYFYNIAFQGQKFGYGSALSMLLVILSLLVVFAVSKMIKYNDADVEL